MSEPTTATYYAAVRSTSRALTLWRKGDQAGVNAELAGMPQGLLVGAAMTLCEVAYSKLADWSGEDFDTVVSGITAELIALESEGSHE